ncbi:NAD(P)/FAD-dependent oxidoreductase [Sinomonas albida]|uniref:flavin-containing monooxygenase n=1 Tax=Sinomonas albida TaxID=369942 RepID=UPI0030183278
MTANNANNVVDAVVVGAGISGLYAIHRLRKSGLSVRGFERGSDVGGTWFWNSYPGARVDIESKFYSYSFDDELQQDWTWSHRYAYQPEILAYLNHVADRFGIREHIKFNTAVVAAAWDETHARWNFTTSDGGRITAKYFVNGSGGLSNTNRPRFSDDDNFAGEIYHSGEWPNDGVDFSGKRVGIIGTGSSGIQMIPLIAKEAGRLSVFQRTAQYAVPAWNRSMDEAETREIKDHYPAIRQRVRESYFGIDFEVPDHGAVEASPEEVEAQLDFAWKRGGYMMLAAYPDIVLNPESNAIVSDWVWKKIRPRIKDPKTAEKLRPKYPFGAKRLCVDTEYFEAFNRDNVDLIDLEEAGIERLVPEGVRLADGNIVELDVLVFATGFDAMTGALLGMNVTGIRGLSLSEHWADGPKNFLGIMIAGFPNLFMITGPGSPSAFYNLPPGIEQHVDWIATCIDYLIDNSYDYINPTSEFERAWTDHVTWLAQQTIFTKVKSWYNGQNIEGKPNQFLIYAGGGITYRAFTEQTIAAGGYRGFELGTAAGAAVHPSERLMVTMA